MGGIVGNVVSVVGVVIVNKWVQQTHNFDYMVFLSFMHFGVTTIGMRVLLQVGLFRYKEASFSGVYKIALGSLGSVGFMNLNLANNTVGVYQLYDAACALRPALHPTGFNPSLPPPTLRRPGAICARRPQARLLSSCVRRACWC